MIYGAKNCFCTISISRLPGQFNLIQKKCENESSFQQTTS